MAKKTSAKVASMAAKTLRSKTATKSEKKVAASALSQKGRQAKTGDAVEKIASDFMKSSKTKNSSIKKIAASVVSQSRK